MSKIVQAGLDGQIGLQSNVGADAGCSAGMPVIAERVARTSFPTPRLVSSNPLKQWLTNFDVTSGEAFCAR
jgi:hypothetical protein